MTIRLLLAAAAALGAMSAAAQERGSFERTLAVGGGPVQLEVRTGSGSIEVTAGSGEQVVVQAEIRARSGLFGASEDSEKVRWIEENPPIHQEGNRIRIGPLEEEDRDRFEGVSISYEIAVPPETSLVARSGSGSQRVGDLRGPVEARSGSGSLTLGRIGSDVRARAGSGSVRIDGVGGNLEVKTGSGSIAARAVAGAIRVQAGSGSIDLEQIGPGNVEVHSSSGGVRLMGARGGLRISSSSGPIRVQGEMTSDWRLEASSGGVTVELPPDAAFELDARTGSGHIDSDHPVTTTGRLARKELQGAVRGGGPRLEIDTSSGSITIR